MATDRCRILFDLIKRRHGMPLADEYVLFLGAGASLSSGAPLFSQLFREVHASNYDQFSAVFEELSDTERHSLIAPTLQNKIPSAAMLLLAELIRDNYFSIILTTNFDRIIEDALRIVDVRADEYDVLINDRDVPLDNLDRLISFGTPRIKIVKLHGDFGRRSYAVTRRETTEFHSAVSAAIHRLFTTRDVIIVGSKFSDMDLLKSVPALSQGRGLWFVNPTKPEEHIKGIMQARGSAGNIISGEDGKFDTFVSRLYTVLRAGLARSCELEWHTLLPFEIGEDYEAASHDSSIDLILREYIPVDCSLEECRLLRHRKHADVLLYWFNHGVGVWVVAQPLQAYIGEFAVKREELYWQVRHGKHWLREETHRLQDAIFAKSGKLTANKGIGYSLSLVHVTASSWPSDKIENAIKLLSWPTLITHINHKQPEDPPPATPMTEVLERENEYLREGVGNDQNFSSFSSHGIQRGYASWSGLAMLTESPERSVPFNEILNYEIELQSCWWYLKRGEQRLQEDPGAKKRILTHYSKSKVSQRLERLLSVGPTEYSLSRQFKDAIIQTSKIKELWGDFRQLLGC